MPPDVSVVIPTFRRPGLLIEAVRSALAQDGVSVEVLVVDDSGEGSAESAVLALGDARVSYQKAEVPSGGWPSQVRQSAWRRAQGAHVAFLDDDDRLAPGGLAALRAALDEHPTAALAFGRVEPFGAEAAELAHEMAFFLDAAHRARHAQWKNSTRDMVSELLFGGSLFVSSAALVRRARLEQLGGLNPAADLMDTTDLAVRAARAHGCLFVDKVVAQYRFDAASLIHDPKNAERMRNAYQAMYKSYREQRGLLEFAALKAYARTIKRWF